MQIKYTEVKGGSDALNGLRNAASAGNAPDLHQGIQDWMVPLVAEKVITDITDWVSPAEKEFKASAFKSSEVDGRNYIVPNAQAPQFFVYQTPVYDKLGLDPPRPWRSSWTRVKVLAAPATS